MAKSNFLEFMCACYERRVLYILYGLNWTCICGAEEDGILNLLDMEHKGWFIRFVDGEWAILCPECRDKLWRWALSQEL